MLLTPALWLVATVYCVNKEIGQCQRRLVRVFGTYLKFFFSNEKCIEKKDSGVKDSHLKPFKGVNINNNPPPRKKNTPNSQGFIFQRSSGPSSLMSGGYLQIHASGQRSTHFFCRGLDSNCVGLVGHTHHCHLFLAVFNILLKIWEPFLALGHRATGLWADLVPQL